MVDNAFGEVTERLRRSTVQVHASRVGSGSSVIWNADGQIVTNAHVLRDGPTQVELWNGRRVTAHVLRLDRRLDIALLQVQADDLLVAAHGDSDALRPGELVIAVGNPFGFVGAVSTGVIHSVGRLIVSDVKLAPNCRSSSAKRGQTAPSRSRLSKPFRAATVRERSDANFCNLVLAPGNSGGPLANARGEVVGINTMIAGGLACAIASNCVAQFLSRAHLGVTVRPMHLGLMVLDITPQSPADRASLRAGDVLVSFQSLKDLEDALSSTREGRLEIEFRRGASTRVRRVVAQVGLSRAA